MNTDRLARLGSERVLAKRRYEQSHRRTLDAILEELAGDSSNAAAAARLTGIARATIYNELARRQQTRDELEPRSTTTPPHDDDGGTNGRPKLSASARRALVDLFDGHSPATSGRARLPERTLDGLRRRGLLEADVLELTPAGRQEAGLLAANTTTENTNGKRTA